MALDALNLAQMLYIIDKFSTDVISDLSLSPIHLQITEQKSIGERIHDNLLKTIHLFVVVQYILQHYTPTAQQPACEIPTTLSIDRT